MNPTACTHISAERRACAIGRNAPQDCATCSAYSPTLHDEERTRAEIWTRVMGYHRPVSAFNRGKQQEHRDRVPFRHEQSAPAVQFQEGAGHD
jgi:hypothetical protein